MPNPTPAAPLVERLRERYTAEPVPPCRVCGRALRVQRAGGGNATVYGCDGLESDPDNPGMLRKSPGYEDTNDHYARSQWTQYRPGDTDVLEAAAVIVELREALEPFAFIARDRNLASHHDSYAPRPSRGRPNMADYRRALAALSREPAGGEG